MLHLTMWADLASISMIFAALKMEPLGKEKTLGLISSLIQCTTNIFDKDIWWREVHSSRLPSLEPEPCSLDCFRQHAHLDKQCMQCSQTGRLTQTEGKLWLKQAQRQVINLCRTTKYSSLIVFSQGPFIFHKASSCLHIQFNILLHAGVLQSHEPEVCCSVSGGK